MTIKTDGLSNTEILNHAHNKRLLTPIQKQVLFLMTQHLLRKACPNCGTEHNLPEAAGFTNIDEYDFAGGTTDAHDRIGKCRRCQRTLIYVLPIIGGWHWRLDHSEAVVSP